MKFCPDCGKPCDGAKFCPECGFDLRPYLPVVHRMVPPEASKSPMVTVTVSMTAQAQPIPDNIETLLAPFGWALNDDGKTYTITGVKDENIQSADIPYGVTIIGEGAFNCCQSLTSITIPDSVTSIGEDAFAVCTSLTNITIPDSVTSIGEGAFDECINLAGVTLSNRITSIGFGTFMTCLSLSSIAIPDSIASIGEYAFEGCKSLTNITLPKHTKVAENAFPATCRVIRT